MSQTTVAKEQESVTISKREYDDLLDSKLRFEFLRRTLTDDIFSPPPTQSAREVIEAFRATGKYNQAFLDRLEQGLKRSSHFIHERSSG